MQVSSGVADLTLVGAAVAVALSTGACAPVFSDLQSARTIGVGRVEVTPSVTKNYFTSDGETDHVEDHLGVQVATGIHERADFRIRYVRADTADVNALGFGPKLSLLPGTLALALPVGFAFGEDVEVSETWEFHPTLIFTRQLSERAELNLSAKSLIPLGQDRDKLVAFNLGFGLGNLDRWIVRPEVGVLFNPGEDGHFFQASLGLTWVTSSAR